MYTKREKTYKQSIVKPRQYEQQQSHTNKTVKVIQVHTGRQQTRERNSKLDITIKTSANQKNKPKQDITVNHTHKA